MNRFSSINFSQRSLSLTIVISGKEKVEVKDRNRTICAGNREFCIDAIRNFMVMFDGSDKKVQFHIYDATGGNPSGVECRAYFKSKLSFMRSSARGQLDIIAHS
ncbi:MAG: hypothetical protein K6D61_08235 [Prevotella sp.]|jgi:hypothetical protein|nr:hypothetical protein [Prevotella sp.]